MNLGTQQEARRVERLEAEILTDEMTQLYNRRGWQRLLDSEEERCHRYGHPAAVLIADLDGLKQVNDLEGHAAGDELISRAAAALSSAARSSDIVARLGGDEFGILSIECNYACSQSLLARVQKALQDAELKGSIGLSLRHHSEGISSAWAKADELMYQEKRRKQNQ